MNYDDLRLEQLRIEQESDSLARSAALAKLIEGAYDGDTELPRAQAVVKNMCGLVVESLKAQAEASVRGVGARYRTWLRALPGNVAAVIAIRECIRRCTGPETWVHVQDLAYDVGKLWELEVRILQAEIVNKPYMQKIHDQVKERGTTNLSHLRKLYGVATERVFKGSLDLTLTKADMIQLGKFGVHACLEAGLIEVEHGTNNKGTTVQYRIAEDVDTFLKGYGASEVRKVLAVEEMRMRCPPDPWTTIYDGGYLSTHRKVAAPLRNLGRTRPGLRQAVLEEFNAEKMPKVFAAANYLQSIPFEFHQPTVRAILKVWGEGGGVMGVPRALGPTKPAFPFEDTWTAEDAPPHEVAVFQRWKRDAARYYEKRKKWKGHMLEVGSFMRSVQKDEQRPFWFPVFFDDRGRWYYRGNPHPQGSDMAKGALHFHRKKPLGERGLFWLKVHIANSSGFDKERMHARAAWTESHWERISEALDDPGANHELWGTDAPWCVYSAAWELREAYRSGNPLAYETGIVVHMDATCSGLQHFSAILRDPVGALYVNLTDPYKIGPKQDIYSKVSGEVLRMLEQDVLSEDIEVRTKAAWFLRLGIPRSLAKTPVMTYVYGATLAGTAQFIEAYYEEELMPTADVQWPEECSSFDMSMYLARKMFAGIERAVPAAAAAMRWLRAVVRAQPSGKPLVWSTPVGFQIVHDYRSYDEVRVALRSCGVQRIIVRDWNDGTRTIPMQNAISPNFVHGLDATHLTMTANAMEQLGHDFVGIHDSFGTHPCDVDDLHRCIRTEFVSLYKRHNLFSDFLWQVGGTLEVPERGSFNLDDVLTSEFMFS